MITLSIVVTLASMSTTKTKHPSMTLFMALFPCVSSLAVALASDSITTTVSIFTITALSAACPPVANVTHFHAVVSSPSRCTGAASVHRVTASVVLTHTLHLAAMTKAPNRARLFTEFAHKPCSAVT